MNIPALSIGMNQAALAEKVSISLLKKVMDTAQQDQNQLVQMLQAPHPTSGQTIDLKV
ncbi:YjfB family protein [Bacillus sp. 31A1R]|uniref:YjfB family protein n=1 Tax=Robertmurraya mangrovi TaxID=3098077 RepID=A0ABU5IY53_9BACI|nr:YjfB family protein [Bacillus sp. 31A1R]MDZ5472098.1 YjfB family protein [Bacillus sp. 31A1R]